MYQPKLTTIMDSHDVSVTTCLLDSGEIVRYDMGVSDKFCKENGFWADERIYYYLGEGVVYSVNGVLQNGTVKNHYWRKK